MSSTFHQTKKNPSANNIPLSSQNKKFTDRNLNSVTKPPTNNSLASQQGKLLVLNPTTKPRIGKSSVGVSVAPTPVNTASLRSEKDKDVNGLVPVGNNIWGHSSEGNDVSNEAQSGESDKTQTRPAPWAQKSQPESENPETQASSSTAQALKETKRRSWADSDDDDDDDPPEKSTPPAPYAVAQHSNAPPPLPPPPPPVIEQTRPQLNIGSQDVRYVADRDGRMDQRPNNNRPFARDNYPSSWQQPDREFSKGRFESNNHFRSGRGAESGRDFEGRGFDNRHPPSNRFEAGRGHAPHPVNLSTHRGHGQHNGFVNTNEWSSGSGHRPHQTAAAVTSGPAEKIAEEQRALEQARLERELLEKKRREDTLKREKEREIAEKERLRVEEEKREIAMAELQRRQQNIQHSAPKQEEKKWERAKLLPSAHPPKLQPPPPQPQPHSQPRSPYHQENHDRSHQGFHQSIKSPVDPDHRKAFSPRNESSRHIVEQPTQPHQHQQPQQPPQQPPQQQQPQQQQPQPHQQPQQQQQQTTPPAQQRKILQPPSKHLYDPKSSSMIEPPSLQRPPQRFDRGFGEENQEKKFHKSNFDVAHQKTSSDDLDDHRKRESRKEVREEKKIHQLPTAPSVPPEDLKLKAEAREARAKAKLERPPRTAGVLYRYDEHGALERVLTEAEKKELAEKEESRKILRESREKSLKTLEKKKTDKIANSSAALIHPDPVQKVESSELEVKQDKTTATPSIAVAEGAAGPVPESLPPPASETAAEAVEVVDLASINDVAKVNEILSAKEDDEAPANGSTDIDLDYLEHLEISSDDARQQSIEFVQVKSKRTISQERKEVKGKETLITLPPSAHPPSNYSASYRNVPEKPITTKKSTIEVIPPSSEENHRPIIVIPPPSKPAWQAPQATLEVLGVPSTSVDPEPQLSVEESETKDTKDIKDIKDKVENKEQKVKDREIQKSSRKKREDTPEDHAFPTTRRVAGRVDTSAAKMHLLRNVTNSRPKSSRLEAHEKGQDEEDTKNEHHEVVVVESEEKIESEDSKASDEYEEQEEPEDEPESQATSFRGAGRGRGRGGRENLRGRGSRRGGRREVRLSSRGVGGAGVDSRQGEDSHEGSEQPHTAAHHHHQHQHQHHPSMNSSWRDRSTRGGRGIGERDSGRRAYKARGPPLSRERITRGPPAHSTNPE